MTDEPELPPVDVSKMPRPPADRPRLTPPPDCPERRRELIEAMRRRAAEAEREGDVGDEDGLSDTEVNRLIREMG